MKKIAKVFIAGLVVLSVLLCSGCASDEDVAKLAALKAESNPTNPADSIPDICKSPNGKYQIGLCISGTMLKDRGFNQFCLDGVKMYAKDNNKTYKYYIPPKQATDNDYVNCIDAAAGNGAEVIVVVGFEYGNALKAGAQRYPDIKFLFIDGWQEENDNVVCVTFRENEGGYLAGYSAVKEGYTNLGFVGGGGGSSDACNRYGRGYICGAEDAARELGVHVDVNYTYQYATTYQGSPELQAMTNAWYTDGTEVIFSAAGAAQDCIAASASANDAWIIACDSDASSRSKSVLTSSLKRTDIATYLTLQECYSGNWDNIKGSALVLSVKEDAIGLPTDTWRFSNFTIADYQKLMDRLKSGEITVDDDHRNNESSEWLTFRYM